jgi:hypothetical protein
MMASAIVKQGTIGNRNLVFAGTFIVPDDEETTLELELQVGGTPAPVWGGVGFNSTTLRLKVILKFIDMPGTGGGEVDWNFDAPTFRFTFRGWKNPLGITLKKPMRAGTFAVGQGPKTDFGFFIASQYLEPNNLVTFQVVTGGTYESPI